MTLFILILIPVVIAASCMLLSNHRVNWKEALVQAAIGVLAMAGGYWAAKHAGLADVEIHNGIVATKDHGKQHCCHSYSCNCYSSCSTDGEGHLSCTTYCSTCYEHFYDLYWKAETSNDETIYSNRCNRPGTPEPGDWTRIRLGEPTAVEHSYINYIKGASRVFFRKALLSRWQSRLPAYPRVNGWQADRFIFSAIAEGAPDVPGLNRSLAELNARLGQLKQVNLIVVVTAESTREFADALAEYWLGGKKNDVVLVVGVPRYPEIAWASVISWTDAVEFRSGLERRVLGLSSRNGFDAAKLLKVLGEEVESGFVRKHHSDFKYLLKRIEPPTWALILLVLLVLVLCGSMQLYFWHNDPFGR